ncbi:protein mono-ADP-ribosyltransferase PARP10 [Xenopus laevis]|uniref:Poly [ADP-ribose] polymerase n=2 Tax=Xenopus laevis TaxID=8355 RepID=A0A1L8FU83_XENLA|nr:protein mono-ADP-ribosyltransferase PARP10 [Xenopus laevis]XP_018079542.1 protein mono-ADP-ribosyltransferase PARP10 [Xenopus laevis]OCT75157.1 hypothetical protein XELAEV_18034148mg [Xenopus laevis]
MAEVEVSGLTDSVDNDFLILYFENKRRSGGGTIRSCRRTGSEALIMFDCLADAEEVLSRTWHHFNDITVQVRRPPPWDPGKLALTNLNPQIENDLLEIYLETLSNREDFTIWRSTDKTKVLVTFQEPLSDTEMESLSKRIVARPLHGASVCTEHVRATTEILVQNVGPKISADLLEMYFESQRRSGGGAVSAVQMLTDKMAAIVSFIDHQVVGNVVRREHALEGCRLLTSPYYPAVLGMPWAPDPDTGKQQKETDGTSDCAEDMSVDQTPTANIDESRMKSKGQSNEPREQSLLHNNEESLLHNMEQSLLQNKEKSLLAVQHIENQDSVQFCAVAEKHNDQNLAEQVDGQLSIAVESIGQLVSQRSGNKLLDPALAQPSDEKVDAQGIAGSVGMRAVQEELVTMQISELRFLQEYHHDLLAGMDQVTIQPLEGEDTTGFKVSGDPFSCQTAVELLQHIVSSLSYRSVTLEYPGVTRFLLGDEGQRLLQETEKLYHCIIDTSLLSWKALELEYVDPWRLVNDAVLVPSVQDLSSEEPPEPANELPENMEDIKRFASLITDLEIVKDRSKESGNTISPGTEDMEQDLYTDRPPPRPEAEFPEDEDDELEQIYKISRDEYQDRHLDEEAQLLLAIQRSMDTQSTSECEDKELQEALAMSLKQQTMEETEENLQMALEMSLKDQWGYQHDMTASSDEAKEEFVPMEEVEKALSTARLRVLTGDETNLVVACAALRKAIAGELCRELLEETQELDVQQGDIISALQRKHGVKISMRQGQGHIEGFSQFINSCRQELIQILKALKGESSPRQPMDLDIRKGVKLLTLTETSEEFAHVTHQFYSSLEELRPSVRVLQVQRVQNVLLHNQYELKKQSMLAPGPGGLIERTLYHGTTEASAREICHNGFNRSFCGKNAALYGQGVYFAVQSVLSTRDTYSPPSTEGKKYVLVAQVLTGEFALGKREMRAPPPLAETPGDAPRRYDSLADSLQNPTIFVIFNDTQAYPQYLITCCKGSKA